MCTSGKPVVMISGANRGIGRAVARHLHETGYRLSLGSRHAGEIIAGQLHGHFDALDPAAAERWVAQTLDRYGRVDALVHCAGVLRQVGLESGSEDDLRHMLEVNVLGSWRLARAVYPHLKACGRGRFIQLVSLSGKRVKGTSCGYPISKFAQLAIGQCVRNSGWDDGVRAVSICPSWVNTDMARDVCKLPPESMTQPEDIARVVALLLSLPNEASVDEIRINCGLETC